MKIGELLVEHFVSDLTSLKPSDFTSLFMKEYGQVDFKVEYAKFCYLDKKSEAKYYIVSYDKDEKEYLVNDVVVAHYQGKGLKMISHGPMPIETKPSLSAAKSFVDQKCKSEYQPVYY